MFFLLSIFIILLVHYLFYSNVCTIYKLFIRLVYGIMIMEYTVSENLSMKALYYETVD